MKTTWLPTAILALLFAAPAVAAVDLTKIDRAIAKEPAYQTKNPKYCLLVFGREAKFRVWLVLDGDVLYVDRNANGDLTGADKRVTLDGKGRVFKIGALNFGGGQYSIGLVRVKDKGRVEIYMNRKVDFAYRKQNWGKDSLMEMAGLTDISFRSWMDRAHIEEYDFQFADRREDAPIVHMDGLLTLRPMLKNQVFVRGDTPTRFPVMVGTPGLGKGTFTQLLFIPGDPDGDAEIVFPHKDPDAKPIVVKVALNAPG